jgi:hypothetical protein
MGEQDGIERLCDIIEEVGVCMLTTQLPADCARGRAPLSHPPPGQADRKSLKVVGRCE